MYALAHGICCNDLHSGHVIVALLATLGDLGSCPITRGSNGHSCSMDSQREIPPSSGRYLAFTHSVWVEYVSRSLEILDRSVDPATVVA